MANEKASEAWLDDAFNCWAKLVGLQGTAKLRRRRSSKEKQAGPGVVVFADAVVKQDAA